MFTQRLSWEALRSIDSATFNGAYQAVGTPLANPSYILKMVNNSNVTVTVSVNGTSDIDVCPANSFWLYDESKVGSLSAFPSMPEGTQIYIKGSAGGGNSGLVYLVSQYIIQA